MNYLPTHFLWPMAGPVEICNVPRICLDNPRGKLELNAVENYLKKWTRIQKPKPSKADREGSKSNQYVTNKMVFDGMVKHYGGEDPYVTEYFKALETAGDLKKAAYMWVIARFDDAGEAERLRKERRRLKAYEGRTVTILDDDHPLVQNKEICKDLSCLITMLATRGRARTFLANDDFSSRIPEMEPYFLAWMNLLISTRGGLAKHDLETEPDWKIRFWPTSKNELVSAAKLAALLRKQISSDEYNHICYLIRNAAESHDSNRSFLSLVGLIEMLLTHAPDHSRFNVEDSISKQFRLKIGVLVHQEDKTVELSEVEAKCKMIYKIRSAIAHGDFKALKKLESESKDELLEDLAHYAYIVVRQYISDPEFVRYLKLS